MPEDKRLGNKWRMRNRNILGSRRQRTKVFLSGLEACRWAAALSERDLAELVGTSHPTIHTLEADDLMLERICQALKAAEDRDGDAQR